MNNTPSRNISLDVIRGIAVLVVMFSHLTLPGLKISTGVFMQTLRIVLSLIQNGGWVGVDLFFVLSGFLVSGLLFKEYKLLQHINSWNFLIRRAFKIYPTFYTFLLVTLLIDITLHSFNFQSINPIEGSKYSWHTRETLTFLSDALFLNNYVGGRWEHTWSLDVEECFYILLTILITFLVKFRKFNFKNFFIFYLFLFFFGIAARYYSYAHHAMNNINSHFEKTHFRLDGMLAGVLLSYVYHFHPNKLLFFQKNKYLLVILSTVFLLTNFIFSRESTIYISVISLAVNPLCFCVLIILAINSKRKIFKSRKLSYVGRISYALYLWHGLVCDILYFYFPINSGKINYVVYFFSFFLISIILAKFFTLIIETPFLKIRDKLFPTKYSAPAIR